MDGEKLSRRDGVRLMERGSLNKAIEWLLHLISVEMNLERALGN